MTRLWRLLLAAILFAIVALPLHAEEAKALRGVALIIGQSAYEHLPPLANPESDARAIEDLFDRLGFDTVDARNADARKLRRTLERFAEDAEGADVAIVYYAGHGIEAGGENYLVPVDADLSALDAAGERLVPVSDYLAALQEIVPVTIVLLDACRDNPFPAGAMVRREPAATPVPVGASGLGETRGAVRLAAAPAKPAETLGSVISFAAAPGRAALDGDPGANSPYAAALLKHLAASGFAFSDVMTMVAEEVWLRTDARQQPWVNSSLRRLLYFGGEAEEAGDDAAPIRGERRRLLLTMAAVGEVQRRQVAATARDKGVPMDALFAMLNALGTAAPGDPDQLARLLDEQATRIRTLLDERDRLRQSDPEIARLTALAGEAVAEGALSAALTFHERAKARVAELSSSLDQAEADVRARRVEHAEVFASSAETYALAYDYARAAADFSQAFAQVERWDARLALRYKLSEAKALVDMGFFRADEAALDRALAAFASAAALAPAQSDPEGWADTQGGMAMALWSRGERSSGTEQMEQAAQILRAAIDAEALRGLSAKRAQLQSDLALVLMSLGDRSAGTETLEAAATAARAALQVRTRETAPMDWARLQNNLGSILFSIGQRERHRDRLEEAVAAYRAALLVWTPQSAPMDWANAQNNLALALGELGSRDPDSARLAEAVKLLDGIFEVRTRAAAPLHWAETHSNRGATLYHLALRESDAHRVVATLGEAADAFRLAMEEITRERSPLKWAGIKDNLGLVLSTTAERTGDTAALDQAIAAYEEALSERTRERVPLEWASSTNNLANAWYRYGELTHDPAHIRKAVPLYEAILEVRTRDRDAGGWASTNNNLANALFSLGTHGGGPDTLREAAEHYRLAVSGYDRATNPIGWADTQYNLSLLLLELGKQTADRTVLADALAALIACRDVYHEAGQMQWDPYFADVETAITLVDTELLVQEKLKSAKK
ncbi:hypothetical protein RHIZO_01551 [Rhizobiaceae bacterium]|nr:hypothetical protein RHIZO_01551 [Rhizobiaceae bacterium]